MYETMITSFLSAEMPVKDEKALHTQSTAELEMQVEVPPKHWNSWLKIEKQCFTWAQQVPTLILACWPFARKDTNTCSLPRIRTPTVLLSDRKTGCRGVGLWLLQPHRRTLAPASSKHWPPDLFKVSLQHNHTCPHYIVTSFIIHTWNAAISTETGIYLPKY